MKNSYNYSGFCKSSYSLQPKKNSAGVVGSFESAPVDNSASRIPPYLAQIPVSRQMKGR